MSGLSPRGRGNPAGHGAARLSGRSIPAWAGEPSKCPTLPTLHMVYPRVGGGTLLLSESTPDHIGLSPRGRGNHVLAEGQIGVDGSIPAWAGEPMMPSCRRSLASVYPRVGGGTNRNRIVPMRISGLSPRGRGNLAHAAPVRRSPGSIPAWAGEPQARHRMIADRGVYPRVGGGTNSWMGFIDTFGGLSPRGRGNLFCLRAQGTQPRSIPAWAGEPPLIDLRMTRGEVYPRVGGGTCTDVYPIDGDGSRCHVDR